MLLSRMNTLELRLGSPPSKKREFGVRGAIRGNITKTFKDTEKDSLDAYHLGHIVPDKYLLSIYLIFLMPPHADNVLICVECNAA